MPRGGSGKGGHNNFLTETSATKTELSTFAKHAREIFEQSEKRPDLHDAEQVKAAVIAYFEQCEKNGIRPGNLGLYAVLGMSKQDVSDVIRGENRSKASPAAVDVIKNAKLAMSVYRETLASSGRINPATYIFMAKNFDQMSDVQQIEIGPSQGQQAQLSPEQIQKQIEQDIPVDVDGREIVP